MRGLTTPLISPRFSRQGKYRLPVEGSRFRWAVPERFEPVHDHVDLGLFLVLRVRRGSGHEESAVGSDPIARRVAGDALGKVRLEENARGSGFEARARFDLNRHHAVSVLVEE